MPARSDLDPIDIPRLLPYTMLINVTVDPIDFSYRLVGSEISQRSAGEYTGIRLVDLPHQRPPSQIWDLFATAAQERGPLCALIPRVGAMGKGDGVQILVMPLSRDGQQVDMLFGLIDFTHRSAEFVVDREF